MKPIGFYSFFLAIFTIFTYLFIDPNLFYLQKFYSGFAFNNREIVSIIFVVLISLFFFFYLHFLKKIDLARFKKLIFASVFILLFAYPAMLSYDIFNYIFTSKVLFYYQENPYVIMPIEFLNDPLLSFTHAPNKLALYGPLWTLITGIPYVLGLENFLLTVINFKILSILFYLGIIFILYKMTNNMRQTAFFALNPLVLIETGISSHNDVVMMFFGIFSLYFLRKNRILLAIVFLVVSILIKYATIFLIPVFVYFFYQKFKDKKIDWNKIYFFSFVSMGSIFFLSSLRGEIYPWYGIWFMTLLPLITNHSLIRQAFIFLSFLLLLRYIPFMFSGTYFGTTPIIREFITFIPLVLFLILRRANIIRL